MKDKIVEEIVEKLPEQPIRSYIDEKGDKVVFKTVGDKLKELEEKIDKIIELLKN